MTTFNINESKIKLAWREKYITDGANERGLASPRGAYRGYWLSPRLVPDTFLRLIIDPFAPPHAVDKDQFAIYADRVNGFSVSIRETTDVEFNCVDLFPVVAATEDWYAYIEADYTPNATTTANYRVEKTDPHNIASPNYDPNAVILGVIPMTLGDLVIDFVVMPPPVGMYARRCIPSPTARQAVADYVDGDEPWGLFDGLSKWCLGTGDEARAFAEPSLDAYPLVAATKFQLSGTYYIGKENAIDVAGQYFRLMHSGSRTPAQGTGRGVVGWSDIVYATDGITPLNPFIDADAEGFYTDPWLSLVFTDCAPDVSFTGTLRVLGFKKKTLLTLENEPASAFPIGDSPIWGHASTTVAKSQAGAPESLAGTNATAQLFELLGHVNDRIETIHPTAVPANWVLLWRSHNVTADVNVTKETCSLYFGAQGVAYLVGGYIDGAGDVVAGGGAGMATYNVMMWAIRPGANGEVVTAVKDSPAAASSWNIDTGWTSTSEHRHTSFLFAGMPIVPQDGITWLEGSGLTPNAINSVLPSGSGLLDLAKWLETTALYAAHRARIYFNQVGMVITSNCYTDASGDWLADDDNFDAIKVYVSSLGLRVLKRHQDDVSETVPWTDSDWNTEWLIGAPDGANEASIACMEVSGDTYEEIHFGFSGHNGASAVISVGADCNYRNKISPAPSSGDFTFTVPSFDSDGAGGTFGVSVVDLYSIDEWGFSVIVTAPSSSPTLGYIYSGSVIIENV